MTRAILRLCLTALAFVIFVESPLSAQAVRIAVSGDASLANLVDVTAGALSDVPNLVVLDRADLDKLGQEVQLQAALTSWNFAGLHVLPADGLILLRAAGSDGKTGVFARLVAVEPGVVLREIALPDGADPTAQAQAIATGFAPYWAKLASIRKGGVDAQSLLGLRFEVDSPKTRDWERSLNLLLASRLSAEPDVLVLERWRLNDAVFEKTLAPQAPAAFWTGSSLIDGSMRLRDGRIEVVVRVRSPHGPEISISDQDMPENLPALAGRLAEKIRNHPLSPTAWSPSSEARHYAELAAWSLDNRLYDEGVSAVESALALGDTSRTTRMLQVKAYAMAAYLDDLRVLNSGYNNRLIPITWDSLPQRLPAATRAASLTRDYIRTNREFSSPVWTLEDPRDLAVPVLNNCLRVLRGAYENGFQRNQPDEVADLRHELQKLIPETEELLRANPSRQLSFFFSERNQYAGLWHETPEETLAFYRERLQAPDGEGIREDLFYGTREPYLDGGGALVWPSGLTRQAPWIVAWDGRSDDELKATWRNFLKELAASPDPVAQADALKFEFYSDQTVDGCNGVLHRIVALLKQHPETLSGLRGDQFAAGYSNCLTWASDRRANAADWYDLLDFSTGLLKQHAALPADWIFEMTNLIAWNMPADKASSLLTALLAYEKEYATQPFPNPQIQEALARARQAVYSRKPELAPATASADALTVHQLWLGQIGTWDHQGPQPVNVDTRTLMTAEGKLWFVTVSPPHKVFCVDPATLQAVATYPIPPTLDPPHSNIRAHHRYLEVTPQWLVVALAGQVLLCSRPDGQWHALDVPPSTYKPRWIDDELYLLYDAEYGDRLNQLNANGASSIGSGLIRVSLPDGKIENLISSRRVPPQSALDGKPMGMPMDLWMTAAGLGLALEGGTPVFQVYTTPTGKNDWASLLTDTRPCRLKATPEGALIGSRMTMRTFQKLTLVNGQGSQVLLANPDDNETDTLPKPLWNFPDEWRSTPPGERSSISPVMRGDDLCVCHSAMGDAGEGEDACLYYFAHGQSGGIKIPLAFDVASIEKPGVAAHVRHLNLDFQALTATSYGLVIAGTLFHGFWVIPWTDIDAYRAKAAAGTNSAVSPAVAR
jgi:hypothetical protein